MFNYLWEIENSKDNAIYNLIEKINFIFFKMSEMESIFGLFRSQEPKFYIILIFRERYSKTPKQSRKSDCFRQKSVDTLFSSTSKGKKFWVELMPRFQIFKPSYLS